MMDDAPISDSRGAWRRRLFFSLLHWSGLLFLWRFWHRRRIAILMVHGVVDPNAPSTWAPLRPNLPHRQFEAALAILSKHYRFISIETAVEMLAGRQPVAPYSLVVTFDDGYRNNLTRAVPILRRYNAPAIIYLATGPIERREPFWFDRLDYALQQRADREVRIGRERLQLPGGGHAARSTRYRQFLSDVKKQSDDDLRLAQEGERVSKELETDSGRALSGIFEQDEWTALLTGDEIRRAADDGLSFGSHTVDHIRPFRLERAVAQDQLERSKKTVEAFTGRPCLHFAYPFGKKEDTTDDTVGLVRACGYQSAATTTEGLNRVGIDLMALRRFPFPQSTHEPEILAKVSGLQLAVTRLKRLVRGG